jgi:hypothetical protein
MQTNYSWELFNIAPVLGVEGIPMIWMEAMA